MGTQDPHPFASTGMLFFSSMLGPRGSPQGRCPKERGDHLLTSTCMYQPGCVPLGPSTQGPSLPSPGLLGLHVQLDPGSSLLPCSVFSQLHPGLHRPITDSPVKRQKLSVVAFPILCRQWQEKYLSFDLPLKEPGR